ncbi:hypothetical protein F5X96DRAFT_491918 [Biscogniauxia mediterranea]|nr:hypothetical protein F5X96DRAFT_491918 [Biscogniauxia mediterranea]
MSHPTTTTLTLTLTHTLRRRIAATSAPFLPLQPRRTVISAASAAAHMLCAPQAFTKRTRRQIIDGNQLQKLSLALQRPLLYKDMDVSERAPRRGTPLPAGYHLAYFTPVGLEGDLGADGTDRAFNPPAPFTRRMWAGGRMIWPRGSTRLLCVGAEVEERTRLVGASAKMGSDGQEMVLVQVDKQFWVKRGLAVIDQRTWIFRKEVDEPSEAAQMPLRDAVVTGPSTVKDVHRRRGYSYRELRWSPVGLFRFSALTFNGHRIHYDPSWCATVEGHRGCVVHGPLNLINMLDYWRDGHPDEVVKEITYRATAPLYAGDTYRIRSSKGKELEQGKEWELTVQRDKDVCMRGTVVSH